MRLLGTRPSPPFKRRHRAFCGKKTVARFAQGLSCRGKEDVSLGTAELSVRARVLERPRAASQRRPHPSPRVSMLKASLQPPGVTSGGPSALGSVVFLGEVPGQLRVPLWAQRPWVRGQPLLSVPAPSEEGGGQRQPFSGRPRPEDISRGRGMDW